MSYIKNATALSLVLLVIGCAGLEQLPSSKLPAESEINAKNFSVASNVGRIYYSIGKVTGGMYEVELTKVSNFYVNSMAIGTIGSGETMAFDLRPGTYKMGFSMNAEPPEKYLDVTISGGEAIILRGDIKVGTTGFGLIGALANPGGPELVRIDKSSIRQPVNLVAPQNCPVSLCVTPLLGAASNASPQSSQSQKASDRLHELNELRKKGLITNADYEVKKAAILKQM